MIDELIKRRANERKTMQESDSFNITNLQAHELTADLHRLCISFGSPEQIYQSLRNGEVKLLGRKVVVD